MSENRYSDGKNSYHQSRYKAQLNHQRAMRAGESERREQPRKNDDGYFISSRRVDRENTPEQKPRQRRISADVNDFDVNDNPNNNYYDNYSRQESIKTGRDNSRRYEKKSILNGKNMVLLVAILLIIAVIILTAVQVVKPGSNDSKAPASGTQETISDGKGTAQGVTQPATQEATVSVTDTSNFVTPKPEDNGESGTMDNGFYVWNDSIFELFYGDEYTIKPYAEAMNRYAEKLGDGIKTYTMIIPTHVEMGLPKRLIQEGEVNFTSQSENIKSAYENLSKSVTPINCYNELAEHCNEYIYFRTDHHWTGLGAYYAYKSFAESTNQDVLSLDTCTKHSIDGFTGTLLFDIEGSVSDDTVEYWEFPYETTNYVYYDGEGEPDELTVYYQWAEGGRLTYGVFIWGDQPLEVLKSDRGTGKKIAIVKESFGNAMVPYFTYNYDEVHVIDFRYWDGDLKSYCEENGITEVLFANGVMSANTSSQIDDMDTLF